jgi:branched-chain amino acid transport system ATP-binding protein
MSKSETSALHSPLIKEVTVGKTLLTVEHDMGVVFGLADKIAVVVYGEVIGIRHACQRYAPTSACKRPTSAPHVADAQGAGSPLTYAEN